MELISIDDVRAAADDVAGTALRTPLLPAAWDDELWLKPESLQPVGSFKLRGATHAVARLGPVVVPEGAPAVKVARMRALGADVRLVPRARRLPEAERIVAETGAALVPPFDHPAVIAGQGTIGLEIVADLPDVEVVLVPVGGGGLGSGVATAVKALRPSTAVIGVEPALAADAVESLAAGEVVVWDVERTHRTCADGLRTNLSALTLAHRRERLDGIVTVTEEEIMSAAGRLLRDARLVAEPSGAVATAARLFHRDELPAGRTVAVVTGGNADPAVLFAALGG